MLIFLEIIALLKLRFDRCQSATLKDDRRCFTHPRANEMSESSIVVRKANASRVMYLAGVLFVTFVPVIGAALSRMYLPTTEWDWISYLAVFFGLPTLVSAVAYIIGWWSKKQFCEYNAPEWKFRPVQMTISEARKLPRTHNRKYRGLVASSNYWMFFVPILMIMYLLGLPVYIYTVDASLGPFVDFLFAIPLGVLSLISLLSGFLATSNSASEDFTLPLVREAVKLAKKQEGVPGVRDVHIVMSKAEHDDFSIYEDPRVIVRIEGLEDEGYIESWSEEIGAVWRMLCRLYESDEHPQVVWWWVSHDRTFRKYLYPDESGYYVSFPVRSMTSKPGVKDVKLLTTNAIAILVREKIHWGQDTEELEGLMQELNAAAD